MSGVEQYLTFRLGHEYFGVRILRVREIIEYSGITEVPLTPSYMRGVINLRGNVIPVVDLLLLFEGRPVEVSRRTCIVIVELDSEAGLTLAGLMVDAVTEVADLRAQDLDPPPAFSSHLKREVIQALGKHQEQVIIILNENLLFSLEQISELSDAAGRIEQDAVPLLSTGPDTEDEEP